MTSTTDPMDFIGGTYSVTIPAGVTMATVDVPIIDDSVLEGTYVRMYVCTV